MTEIYVLEVLPEEEEERKKEETSKIQYPAAAPAG